MQEWSDDEIKVTKDNTKIDTIHVLCKGRSSLKALQNGQIHRACIFCSVLFDAQSDLNRKHLTLLYTLYTKPTSLKKNTFIGTDTRHHWKSNFKKRTHVIWIWYVLILRKFINVVSCKRFFCSNRCIKINKIPSPTKMSDCESAFVATIMASVFFCYFEVGPYWSIAYHAAQGSCTCPCTCTLHLALWYLHFLDTF